VNATDALKPKLTLTKLLPPPDDETLKVKGTAVIPAPIVPPLRPHEDGVRFLVTDAQGDVWIDADIPPGLLGVSGTGWMPHPTSWTWRSTTGIEGVRLLKAKILGSGPGHIGFKVVVKNGSLPVTAGDLPLSATIVFDPPLASTGRCGDARFPGLPGPSCTIDGAASKVRCR
jgi:hypothetical protein